jgi:hypothetical protein
MNDVMSSIRPSLKRRPGSVFVGLLAASVTLLPAAAAGATTHHLVFSLVGPSIQNVVDAEAVVVMAKCPTEACKVDAYASSTTLGLRTAKVRATVKRGGSTKISLPLTPVQDTRLRSALEAGNSRQGAPPIVAIHATAKDDFGTEVPVLLDIKIAKP